MDDALVIGAGVSGMSCALALAKAGRSVRLIEKAPRTAPVIRSFVRDGLTFDCGFHYAGSLGPGELFTQILSYVNVYDKLKCKTLAPDGTDLIRIEKPSVQVPLPWGWERVQESLCSRFPAESDAIVKYLAMVRQVQEDIPLNFAKMDNPLTDRLLADSLSPSVESVLDELTDDRALKAVLTAQSFLYGSKPNETPFIVHARVLGTHFQSLYQVDGGGTAIANAFTDTLAEAGVTVETSAEAANMVLDESGNVTSVRLANGDERIAKDYVFSGHPKVLAQLLADRMRTGRMGKRLQRLQDSLSAYILFCVTDSMPTCLNESNLIVRHDLKCDILRDDVPIDKRGFFASFCQPATDGRYTFTALFPESHTTVGRWAGSKFGRRGPEYEAFKRETTRQFLNRLQMGVPELEGKVRAVCAATPLTVKHYCSTPDTAGIYGTKHRCGQLLVLPKTRIANLYQCGQSVITPGLFGAVYSGLVTTAVMTGGTQMRKELFQ